MTVLKADTARELHIAHVGRSAFTTGMTFDRGAADGRQLVQRYGMWVARCVQLNAQAAAGVPFKLMRVQRSPTARKSMIRNGVARELTPRTKAFLRGRMSVQPSESVRKAAHGNVDDMVEVERHPVLELMHDVNDWTDGYAFRESLYSDIQIFGRAFSLMIDGPRGAPLAMWRQLPQLTEVIKDPVDFVRGFKVGMDPDSVVYDADEVLWFRLYDPDDPWGGVGPLEAWLKTVDASFHIQDFQNWLMKRGGSPDWGIISEAPMHEHQKRQFRKSWRRLFGKLFNREESVAFISGKGVTLQKLTDSNKELQFIESENQKRDQIGQAFGVPKSILDVSEIRANNREAKAQHIEYTVWPMIKRVEDVWNERLVPRFGDDIFLVHDNPVPDDETIRIQDRESRLRSGYSINEVRAMEGDEPIDDPRGDEPMIQTGLVTLDQSDLTFASMSAGVEDGGEAMEGEPADLPDVDVQPQQVLQGAQITAATNIVVQVVDGKLPLEAARGQLMVLFNLEQAQADQMLAGVEEMAAEREREREEMRDRMPQPGAPGNQPPGNGPPGRNEEQQRPPREERMFPSALVQMAALKSFNGHEKQPVNVYNMLPPPPSQNYTINNGQPMLNVQMPQQEPPMVNIVTEGDSVTVNSEAPIVNMPEQKFSVESPNVLVENTVPVPVVNVEPPDVHVDVEQPDIEVRVEQPDIDVRTEAPIVNIQNPDPPAPKVTVVPKIDVNLIDQPPDDDADDDADQGA